MRSAHPVLTQMAALVAAYAGWSAVWLANPALGPVPSLVAACGCYSVLMGMIR